MVRYAVEFIQITWNCTRVRTLTSYMSPLSLVLCALIFPEIVLLYTPPPYYLEICITDKKKIGWKCSKFDSQFESKISFTKKKKEMSIFGQKLKFWP